MAFSEDTWRRELTGVVGGANENEDEDGCGLSVHGRVL